MGFFGAIPANRSQNAENAIDRNDNREPRRPTKGKAAKFKRRAKEKTSKAAAKAPLGSLPARRERRAAARRKRMALYNCDLLDDVGVLVTQPLESDNDAAL